MQWYAGDTWIVIIAALAAMSCALLGNFLVLRRMSMMGDAISHAVLPGLAVAFLLTGSRSSLGMFIGAVVVGALTAALISLVSRFGKVEEGASMGVVFTILFALGLVLMVRASDYVDLDPSCVLYGALEMTPLDTMALLGWEIPRAAAQLGGVLLLNLLFVSIFFKELKLGSFDPQLAATLGFAPGVMHQLLMIMVAITTVAAFESVGSILVIGMLIAPPAAAYLLTDRLGVMILLSLGIAVLCAAGGHVAAIVVPGWFGYGATLTSGMMATLAGGVFIMAMLLAPRRGVLVRMVRRGGMAMRILREDMLATLYRHEESNRRGMPAGDLRQEVMARLWQFPLAVRGLLRQGTLCREGGSLRLTDAGRRQAMHLLRSHRLWESYLVRGAEFAPSHTHPTAEWLEHITTPGLQRSLEEELGDVRESPSGKPIPGPGN